MSDGLRSSYRPKQRQETPINGELIPYSLFSDHCLDKEINKQARASTLQGWIFHQYQ